jgi:ribosomal protein L10
MSKTQFNSALLAQKVINPDDVAKEARVKVNDLLNHAAQRTKKIALPNEDFARALLEELFKGEVAVNFYQGAPQKYPDDTVIVTIGKYPEQAFNVYAIVTPNAAAPEQPKIAVYLEKVPPGGNMR